MVNHEHLGEKHLTGLLLPVRHADHAAAFAVATAAAACDCSVLLRFVQLSIRLVCCGLSCYPFGWFAAFCSAIHSAGLLRFVLLSVRLVSCVLFCYSFGWFAAFCPAIRSAGLLTAA